MPDKLELNKLVRDHIPELLDAKGIGYQSRMLDAEEFEQELKKKVLEEAGEVAASESYDELVAEIADLEFVLATLKELKGIEAEDIDVVQRAALERKGGFAERVFMEWTDDDGYKNGN